MSRTESSQAKLGLFRSATGYLYSWLTIREADAWVEKHFAGSRIHQLWTLLPSGILVSHPHLSFAQADSQRSDTLRYLLLLVHGGIYSDTDTRLRKPPSRWGRGATLWANGKGLKKEEKARIAAGEKWEEVLGPPSVIIGIEADVGERDDWNDWWPRPVSRFPVYASLRRCDLAPISLKRRVG